MEQPLGFRGIDVIFSIQALGWTRDPDATLCNLVSYLKPGGRLVWSWGHPLFDKIVYADHKLALHDPISTNSRNSREAGAAATAPLSRPERLPLGFVI